MADNRREALSKFVQYVATLSGDEKGEAQVFLDRLFQAFGHEGYKEAGATLESRVRAKGKGTRFADLLWSPRVLIEMKKRGESLHLHYAQARDYWHDTYPKPRYVVLCNFDEFWVYDFFSQSDPVDQVAVADLPERYLSLAFLLAQETRPQFGNDRVAVSRKAANQIALLFNSLITRGIDRTRAQRFILQCVFCLFAEDFELLPRGLFTSLIGEAAKGSNTYDLFGQLFKQMDTRPGEKRGRFKEVDYFNGGLFGVIDPIELVREEVALLEESARENWSKVQPPIFGALFEGSLGKEERHAFGAHFTNEADIMKVVRPTIERPWLERIEAAKTLKELQALRDELLRFQVLDPACGCGNFLYVAYREMRRLEMRILQRIHTEFGKKARAQAGTRPLLSLKQFHGIDINGFAVELAKVTLMLGREQGIEETRSALASGQLDLPLEQEPALPLDNLDDNIVQADALFTTWPKVDAIIGNPPFLGAKRMKPERGRDYVERLRRQYTHIPGMADYCVYWFRKANEALGSCTVKAPTSGRAGLVGTQNVRNNESRKGGLEHICQSGTIIEAIDSQKWSGEAKVYVSIVNWMKTQDPNLVPATRRLWISSDPGRGADLVVNEVDHINPDLTDKVFISVAKELLCNLEPARSFNGQMIGHESFVLSREEMSAIVSKDSASREVIYPYLNGRELLEHGRPERYLIDFQQRDQFEAARYAGAFEWVKTRVLPDRKRKAEEGKDAEGNLRPHHKAFLNRWWQLSFCRPELIGQVESLSRFICCSLVTKRQVFHLVDSKIRPSNLLQVFTLDDDYSFGILQSGVHWLWFKGKSSKLKGDYRFGEIIWNTFPWPQSPTLKQAQAVAKAAVELRQLRRDVMAEHGWSLRDLYRTLETPGANPLRDAQEALDAAVRAAYGMKKSEDILAFLLKLNHEVADREAQLLEVTGPGLPPCVQDPKPFITEDCITV
ncbi:MAG: DNA methyltransferase [Candidatus Sumerlaeia bacterium]|nr:DNA methyltransferase [Candidatus Sumerlaeia bacterium]